MAKMGGKNPILASHLYGTGRYLRLPASCWLRSAHLYLRWNFSTRPVVSTYFILPVKKGWHAEQISTAMVLRVLRVVNLLPQPQVTVASTYSGWMPDFMAGPCAKGSLQLIYCRKTAPAGKGQK